jgi:hypothetical protein
MYLGVNYIKKFEVYMDMFQVVCIWGSMKIEASLGIEYVKSRSTYIYIYIWDVSSEKEVFYVRVREVNTIH